MKKYYRFSALFKSQKGCFIYLLITLVLTALFALIDWMVALLILFAMLLGLITLRGGHKIFKYKLTQDKIIVHNGLFKKTITYDNVKAIYIVDVVYSVSGREKPPLYEEKIIDGKIIKTRSAAVVLESAVNDELLKKPADNQFVHSLYNRLYDFVLNDESMIAIIKKTNAEIYIYKDTYERWKERLDKIFGIDVSTVEFSENYFHIKKL